MDNLKEYVLEPIDFIFSKELLSAERQSEDADYSSVIDRFFSQEEDSISERVSQAVADLHFQEKYNEAEQFVENLLLAKDDILEMKYLQYRKKKLKKETSSFDEFFFSVFDEIYSQLQYVAINRYINGVNENSFFEKLFEIYKAGKLPY